MVESISMTWKYNDEDFVDAPKGMEGFVYLITNLTNDRKYIGKKSFWTRRKDKKTGRRKTKESDWKNYFGSCDELNEDVKILGKEYFEREILYLCPHKKSMSYYETMEQFKRDVLMTDDYYNTNIEGRFFVSERSGIYEVVMKNDKFRDMRSEKMKDKSYNPMYKPEVREKFSKMYSGEGNPMYGKKLTEEHKKILTTSRNVKVSDGTNTWESVTSYIKEKKIGFQTYKKQLKDGLIFTIN
jgi:hypothetical protein